MNTFRYLRRLQTLNTKMNSAQSSDVSFCADNSVLQKQHNGFIAVSPSLPLPRDQVDALNLKSANASLGAFTRTV